ncbi:hypothetical protein TrVE_jg5506 [Triparma verrucosa]|uniref:Uncharacterized protein n=1 Tax=Triparma verrucosa TaxID=1606542 RepID=A0A9W7FMD5_9STRA|nr:hypothetical protein TrVE_jg5506 [Triparma verrucosa]
MYIVSTLGRSTKKSTSLKYLNYELYNDVAQPFQKTKGVTTKSPSPSTILSCITSLTGTTVGATLLTFPPLAHASPLPSSLIFLSCYSLNLLSGLVLVKLFVESETDNFKDLTESILPNISKPVQLASTLMNGSILVYCLHSFPPILNSLLSLPSTLPLSTFESLSLTTLTILLCLSSSKTVDNYNKLFVTGMFSTFLILCLQSHPDVPDVTTEWSSLKSFLPLTLLGGVYQNMIPHCISLIKTDLTEDNKYGHYVNENDYVIKWSNIVIAAGSLIPTLMFIIWCMIDSPSSIVNTSWFEIMVILSSTIGCMVSLKNELPEIKGWKNTVFMGGLAGSVAVGMGGGLGGEEVLDWVGGGIVPFLYFGLPGGMKAVKERREKDGEG